ncbi:Uncharacterized protein dnm_008440 [Desulfonema magnum]|uniref:Myosin heavy chain n=2 Tax=Desulfonema magnum TaxID=45655 RepID=A0A975BGG2_9BACT|nr:Uncharacterized protein dnm_008440 [Desulfonema magnum]
MDTQYSDPQAILKAFKKLQADHAQQDARIATKEDISAIQEEKDIVAQAVGYTAESIFQSLSQLQTTFGESAESLIKTMKTEAEKLACIRKAIQIEDQLLKALHDIQVAAESLNILQQEHQKAIESVEESYQQEFDELENETVRQKQAWANETQVYQSLQTKQEAAIQRERQQEEEKYDYDLQRERTEASDEYEKRKRMLEYELEEENRNKEKDWTEREKYLGEHQEQSEEYKTQVEAMPTKIEEAVKKAREDAIRDTAKEEEHKAQLLEKDAEARKNTFELKIESLTKTVEVQAAQIAVLSEKLQAALEQVQQLALTAVTSAGQSITGGNIIQSEAKGA